MIVFRKKNICEVLHKFRVEKKNVLFFLGGVFLKDVPGS